MLTQNEKEWLRERKFFPLFSCIHCKNKNFYILNKTCFGTDARYCIEFHLIELKHSLYDEVEFEARVAKKLAEFYWITKQFEGCIDLIDQKKSCPCLRDCAKATKMDQPNCADRILKCARLAVEEEMENVNK